jgi:uncharacterized protein YbaP (TraB family)
MKRSILLLVFAALAACKQSPPTSSHTLFWAAEKGGKTTYLLGTMHVGVDAKTQLPAEVWKQLDAAPVFAMETDPADPVMQTMAEARAASLHADLGDTYWHKFEIEMTPAVAAQLDHAKPLIAAVMLSLKGFPQTEPMDGALAAAARTEHKPIVFLEPAAKQIALLEKWLDTRAIKAILDHPAESAGHDREMLAAYLAGDEARMTALAAHERATAKADGYTDAEYDQEMTDLVYERNASWIDEIEKLHAQDGAFIAVGALHLIGPRSVLDLLAHRGYTVHRVQP